MKYYKNKECSMYNTIFITMDCTVSNQPDIPKEDRNSENTKFDIQNKLESFMNNFDFAALDNQQSRPEDIEKFYKPKKLRFDWEGELSDLKSEYTAVELKHKSLDWMKCT